ncbi:TolC family protein [Labilibaculum sp.]|uniref:TolC family protein n=1 Tax=Labilibaculum sp. TaxID=2060723 RepID=UPI00356198B1
MLKIFLFITLSGLSLQGMPQSTVSQVLQEIEKNNPHIQAQQSYLEAQKLGFRAENNLADPEVEWEKSFSSEEGKPYEVLVSQSFDFPSAYLYKKQIKNQQIANLSNQFAQIRQEVLLQSELICLELIYRNKQKKALETRVENAQKLADFFEKRLQEGDANILETNKIKMLLLNTTNQLAFIQNKILRLEKDLQMQNGGSRIDLSLENYPIIDVEKEAEQILDKALQSDPYLNQLRSKQEIASTETSLVKSNSLPTLSIGYRYINSDIMKEAHGMKLGISIPLWENKHKVKQAKLLEQFRKEEVSLGKMQKESEYEKLFQRFLSLQVSLSNYQDVFVKKDYDRLLQKALQYGEISGIEYLMESIYYYESFDTYLETEHEYYLTKAKIGRYLL